LSTNYTSRILAKNNTFLRKILTRFFVIVYLSIVDK
jgi:hypothetical protein